MSAILVVMVFALFPGQQANAIQQWSGVYGGRSVPGAAVISDQQAWIDLWTELRRDPPLRVLDTRRQMAVVVFSGMKPTGGYGVSVKTAHATNDGQCVVEYVETAPEPGRVVTQALTTPWVVALVPSTTLPVVFKRVER